VPGQVPLSTRERLQHEFASDIHRQGARLAGAAGRSRSIRDHATLRSGAAAAGDRAGGRRRRSAPARGSRYSRKLAPAVERTIAYFIECGQWLAAPVEFSARRWAGDPLVRTLFATSAELQRFFSDDPGVRAYFHDHPLADEVYIGLGVTRHERRAFGMAMSGEVMQREVLQTVISFSDYRLFGACDNEQQLRQNIEQRGFGFLIARRSSGSSRIRETHTAASTRSKSWICVCAA